MAGIPTIVENRSKLSPQVLEAQIETKAGETLNVETLNKDINRLYSLDTFERVDFHLEQRDGKTGLIFDPVEKSWGPTYLRFSLSLADDFKGINCYTIGGRITRTEINALGAEWRNQLQIGDLPRLFSEFYQPLDFGTRYFIAPRIEYREWDANIFIPSTGNVIAEYRIGERFLASAVTSPRWRLARAGRLPFSMAPTSFETPEPSRLLSTSSA